MSSEEEYFFEEINLKNLKLNRTKLFIIFSAIVLILFSILLTINLTIFHSKIYDPLSILLIAITITSSFWIINSFISYFLRKNTLEFVDRLNDEERKELIISTKKKSLCFGCGKELHSNLFQANNFNMVKPYTLFRTTGYYCRECFRKYFLINSMILFIEFLVFYSIFFPIAITYFELLESLAIIYLLLILLLTPLEFLFIFLFNLKQYKNSF